VSRAGLVLFAAAGVLLAAGVWLALFVGSLALMGVFR
jgi:hypothetical protein